MPGSYWLSVWFTLWNGPCRQHILPKRHRTSIRLHDIQDKNTIFFSFQFRCFLLLIIRRLISNFSVLLVVLLTIRFEYYLLVLQLVSSVFAVSIICVIPFLAHFCTARVFSSLSSSQPLLLHFAFSPLASPPKLDLVYVELRSRTPGTQLPGL